jgi:hypothetical protein
MVKFREKARMIRFIAVYCAVPILLGSLGGFPDLALAQTVSTTANSTSLPVFNTATPVQFSAAGIANIGALFGSCMLGGVSAGLGGLQGTGSALPNNIADVASQIGGSVGGSCTGTDQTPQSQGGGNICSFNSDGSPNNTLINQMISQGQNALNSANCKLRAIQKVQSDISCMQTQANSLQQQIQSLSSTLQTNLTKQATDVGTIQGVITDRTQQGQQVNLRLTGSNDGTGTTGLIGAQTALNTELKQLSTDIPAQQAQVTQIAQLSSLLVVQAQQRTMSETALCFQNTVNTNFHCTPNGPAVSAEAYVLCRVQQNAMITSGGSVNNNSVTSQQASGVESNMQSLLTNIFAQAASFQTAPTDAASSLAQQEQTQTVQTPNDIEVQFGALLHQFDGTNFPVHDTVMAAIRNCYAQSQSAVNAEETRPGTALYQAAQAITTQQTSLKATVDQELQDMTQAYTGALAALTLQHVPLTTGQCTSATVQNEMKCVTDLQANLQGILQGNSSNSTVTVNIASNDTGVGSSPISFQCQGINGCVTLYRQVQQNLGNEVNRLGSEKVQYVTQANAQTDAYMNQIKTSLSGQSQMLQTKMQQLNSSLAMLGISPIGMTPYTSTPMTKDGDPTPPSTATGLYQMPPDLLATIGGGLTPPLLNLNGDSFTSGLSQIAQALQQEQQNVANDNTFMLSMQSTKTSCQNQAQSQAKGLLNSLGQNVITSCSGVSNYCPGQGGGYDSVASTLSSADNIMQTMGAGSGNGGSGGSGGGNGLLSMFNVTSSLRGGYDQACQKTSQASSGSSSKVQQDVQNLNNLAGIGNTGVSFCPPQRLHPASISNPVCEAVKSNTTQYNACLTNYVPTLNSDALAYSQNNAAASGGGGSACNPAVRMLQNAESTVGNSSSGSGNDSGSAF